MSFHHPPPTCALMSVKQWPHKQTRGRASKLFVVESESGERESLVLLPWAYLGSDGGPLQPGGPGRRESRDAPHAHAHARHRQQQGGVFAVPRVAEASPLRLLLLLLLLQLKNVTLQNQDTGLRKGGQEELVARG